jgi:hypothetical protein
MYIIFSRRGPHKQMNRKVSKWIEVEDMPPAVAVMNTTTYGAVHLNTTNFV